MTYLGERMKNDVSRREDEERRISRRENEERRISYKRARMYA